MKLLFVYLLFVLASNHSISQTSYYHPEDRGDQVYSNRNLIFTFSHIQGNWKQRHLRFYSQNGELVKSQLFEWEKNSELVTQIAVGDFTVVVVKDRKKMFVVVFNSSGEEVKREIYYDVKINSAQIHELDNNSFVIIEERKAKNNQVLAYALNLNLEILWLKELNDKSDSYTLGFSAISKDKALFVYGRSKTGKNWLCELDKSGNILNQHELNLTPFVSANVTFMKAVENGLLIVGHYYDSFSIEPTKLPIGLFTVHLFDQRIRYQTISFSEIATNLIQQNKLQSTAERFPVLEVFDANFQKGKLELITEGYFMDWRVAPANKSLESNFDNEILYSEFETEDLYILYLEEERLSVKRIWKPRTLYSIPNLLMRNALNLVELAHKNRLFGFQDVWKNQVYLKGVSKNRAYFSTIDYRKVDYDAPQNRFCFGPIKTSLWNESTYKKQFNSPSFLQEDLVFCYEKGITLFLKEKLKGGITFTFLENNVE